MKAFDKSINELMKSTPFKEVDPAIKEDFKTILKTSRKSPLMALGLLGADPNRILMDSSTKGTTTSAGMYFDQGSSDLLYFNDKVGQGAGVLAHELTHRSIRFLSDTLPKKEQEYLQTSVQYNKEAVGEDFYNKTGGESSVDINELVVRYIVDKYGIKDDVQRDGKTIPASVDESTAQHKMAQYVYKTDSTFRDLVEKLEKAARLRIMQNEKR